MFRQAIYVGSRRAVDLCASGTDEFAYRPVLFWVQALFLHVAQTVFVAHPQHAALVATGKGYYPGDSMHSPASLWAQTLFSTTTLTNAGFESLTVDKRNDYAQFDKRLLHDPLFLRLGEAFELGGLALRPSEELKHGALPAASCGSRMVLLVPGNSGLRGPWQFISELVDVMSGRSTSCQQRKSSVTLCKTLGPHLNELRRIGTPAALAAIDFLELVATWDEDHDLCLSFTQ